MSVAPEMPSLGGLLDELACGGDDLVVVAPSVRMSLTTLRAHIERHAEALREAGVGVGTPVAVVVDHGVPTLISMFAIWSVGGVYVPVNGRYTPTEVAAFLEETPVALVVAGRAHLERLGIAGGAVEYDETALSARVIRPAAADHVTYEPDVALVLRTSGTSGRPKAVLLRHSGTVGALDSSIRKLRHRGPNGVVVREGPLRMNMIPTSLALWAGIYNVTFSLRAGFGVVLLDKFAVDTFVDAIKEFEIRSTVLAPAMIQMLVEAEHVTDLSPLQMVRSITAPLSPEVARQFHEKFGVLVLNSYGQTELGGEVVGWTKADVLEFGPTKLGAAGRPYDEIDIRIVGADGSTLSTGEYGEIHVNSPFRMRGYAGALHGEGMAIDDSRFVDGYLQTGDMGWIDDDGFVWIQGRISDMINRGGLKVFPDEVEEVLRQHPKVVDAAVAGVPDRRLGDVPYAWVIVEDESVLADLGDWCRERLAPYKIPVGFATIDEFPRNDIGKLLRRELSQQYDAALGAGTE